SSVPRCLHASGQRLDDGRRRSVPQICRENSGARSMARCVARRFDRCPSRNAVAPSATVMAVFLPLQNVAVADQDSLLPRTGGAFLKVELAIDRTRSWSLE